MTKNTNEKSGKAHWISQDLSKSSQKSCTTILKILNKNNHDNLDGDAQELQQNFRKLRALLRLVRDSKTNYSKENKFLRDEAKKIASVSHAAGMIEGLDLIQDQYNERIYKKAFTDIRTYLEEHKDAEIEKVLNEQHVLQDMHQNLEPRCEKITSSFDGINSFKTIGSGIKRVYKRGKKEHTKALNSKSSSNLHELHKRVQYLEYQLEAINPVWTTLLTSWKNELNELSAFLRSYHNLSMLKDFIAKTSKNISAEDGSYLLGTLVAGHQEQLRKHALLLGKKLYHLSPKHFISLLEVAWETHDSEMDKKLLPSDKLER